jgi:hypothetical protein
MYPQGKHNATPEYVTAAAAILSDFPRVVAQKCCDEYRGIAHQLKYHPSLAELREWCEIEFSRRAPHRVYPLLPPLEKPARTPEQQARVDAQVADWKVRR